MTDTRITLHPWTPHCGKCDSVGAFTTLGERAQAGSEASLRASFGEETVAGTAEAEMLVGGARSKRSNANPVNQEPRSCCPGQRSVETVTWVRSHP